MLGLRHYLLQRITALLMAPLVLGHLAVMIYAVQGGLSAAEILGRTQGSVPWLLFYGTFAVAVSIHAAIGIRSVAHEWIGLKGVVLEAVTWVTGLGLFTMGARAVWAVTFA
ncbi:MAG: succinate dehydrogenase [Rhodobacter sp.]|nr:succinate dehydrogenase [Rhodobacter sp.]